MTKATMALCPVTRRVAGPVVTPHAEMRAQISRAAGRMRPVLDLPMTGLHACTVTVARLIRVSCMPTTAVYIAPAQAGSTGSRSPGP
jgi:hypothetical protein